jgi:hypothetical protein
MIPRHQRPFLAGDCELSSMVAVNRFISRSPGYLRRSADLERILFVFSAGGFREMIFDGDWVRLVVLDGSWGEGGVAEVEVPGICAFAGPLIGALSRWPFPEKLTIRWLPGLVAALRDRVRLPSFPALRCLCIDYPEDARLARRVLSTLRGRRRLTLTLRKTRADIDISAALGFEGSLAVCGVSASEASRVIAARSRAGSRFVGIEMEYGVPPPFADLVSLRECRVLSLTCASPYLLEALRAVRQMPRLQVLSVREVDFHAGRLGWTDPGPLRVKRLYFDDFRAWIGTFCSLVSWAVRQRSELFLGSWVIRGVEFRNALAATVGRIRREKVTARFAASPSGLATF